MGTETHAYVGRLAPSPSGDLHLGHVRTFLVAWLRARQAGGRLALRMDDLDTPRMVPGAADRQMEDLTWLGLAWDGEPVVQSAKARQAAYAAALAQLMAEGLVYPCTCSRAEIATLASAPHNAAELGLTYPGTCRGGVSHPGRPETLRFRMVEPAPSFRDVFHGEVDGSGWGGDFAVRRVDGLFAYQLAVVVDDAAAGVTEVVRGDDLLSSTPRQLALYEALGLRAPAFLHVPLVMGPSGDRLAKRDAAAAIRAMREAGKSAAAIIGQVAATLGLRSEPAMPADLVSTFNVASIPHERIHL